MLSSCHRPALCPGFLFITRHLQACWGRDAFLSGTELKSVIRPHTVAITVSLEADASII